MEVDFSDLSFSSLSIRDYNRYKYTEQFVSPHPTPPLSVTGSSSSSGTFETAPPFPSSSEHLDHARVWTNAVLLSHLIEPEPDLYLLPEPNMETITHFDGHRTVDPAIDFSGLISATFPSSGPTPGFVGMSTQVPELPPLPRHLFIELDSPNSSQASAPSSESFDTSNSFYLNPIIHEQEAAHVISSVSIPQAVPFDLAPQIVLQQETSHIIPPISIPQDAFFDLAPRIVPQQEPSHVIPPVSVPVQTPNVQNPFEIQTRPSQHQYQALEEDPGNDADTEFSSNFGTRRHRRPKPKYFGDALISLNDIRQINSGKNCGPIRSQTSLPRRRLASRIRLSDQIRDEIAALTGMDRGKSLVSVCQELSNNELNTFASIWKATSFHHMHSDCCDIKNFFIDLVNTPRSPWNQSAARVFTVHFIKTYRLSNSGDMVNIVQESFYVRIKTLQASLRRENAGQETIALCLQATRRWLRKQTLFNNRWIATGHPLLRRHRPMLMKLGVGGMSTDESDQEPSTRDQPAGQGVVVKTFRVRVPIWRTSNFTPPLRWMDKVYLIVRRMSKTLRGALPRIRIAPDYETELALRAQAYPTLTALGVTRTKFVNNLPKCGYDSTWFSVFQGDGFDLRYTNEEYDFTVEVKLIELVQKYYAFVSHPRPTA